MALASPSLARSATSLESGSAKQSPRERAGRGSTGPVGEASPAAQRGSVGPVGGTSPAANRSSTGPAAGEETRQSSFTKENDPSNQALLRDSTAAGRATEMQEPRSSKAANTRSSGGRGKSVFGRITFTGAPAIRKVRFEDVGDKDTTTNGRKKKRWSQKIKTALASPAYWLRAVRALWIKYSFRELVIMSSLCELWSMGIWLAFIVEEDMADVLLTINTVDMVANSLYLVDKLLQVLDECSTGKFAVGDNQDQEQAVQQTEQQNHQRGSGANRWLDIEFLKTCAQVLLASSMYPMQMALRDMLLARVYPAWEVTIVLLLRLSRVAWAVTDCMRFVKRLELQVYVNVRMRGSEGSWRVIVKQFLIVMFFGHWFGCFAFALKGWGKWFLDGTRHGNKSAKEYFEKFEEQGMVPYKVGVNFGETYLLAIYKGFNLNLEDLLPERPDVLVLEMMCSIFVVMMKSYCIGSFFKHHQSREVEKQKFKDLIALATSYIDSHQLPPSLRKAVIRHFEFMDAKENQRKTLEVLSRLPPEVQKKLKEHEQLPVVRDRNPVLFSGVSHDFGMELVMLLTPSFLQPGEIIFLQGEAPRELLFLDMGTVSLSRKLEQADGKSAEHLIRYLRADRNDDPTVLGEYACILSRAHMYCARVRAGVEVSLLGTTKSRLADLLAKWPAQHDTLVRNIADMWLLDIEGKDYHGREKTADQENDTFVAMQGDVRKVLIQRKEAQNADFTFAAGAGDVKSVLALLAKRADVNNADYDGRSPMHVAASEGMNEVLEVLLTNHGNPNLKDRWGSTPMQDALKNGYYTAAKTLMRHKGVLDIADPAGALCTHASEGDTMKMQQLLDFRVDANMGDYDGRTALHLSACEGHVTVVTFLSSRGANVNVKDRWNNTPMEDAIRSEFSTVARHIRAEGGSLNAEFAANLLCDAASTGNLLQLQMLNECGVDVNEGDYDFRTALHLAAAEGQPLALNYLLFDANANPSPLDRWEATPLQDALVSNDGLCAPLLIMAGGCLGPSATQEQREEVARMKKEWFGNKGDRYGTLAREMRKKIGRQMQMVEAGRARTDMFDVDAVAKFSKQLLHQQIDSFRPLSRSLKWLADLVSRLECALKTVKLLLETIEDGSNFHKEAKFWATQTELPDRFKSKKGGDKAKDVNRYVFDTVFLQSMKVAPSLVALTDYVTDRIIHHADSLKAELEVPSIAPDARALAAGGRDSQNSQRRLSTRVSVQGKSSATAAAEDVHNMEIPAFAQLIVAEILKACGWSDEFDIDKVDSAGMHVTGSMEEMRLTAKFEKVAGVLLKGEHFHVGLASRLLGEFRQHTDEVTCARPMNNAKIFNDAKVYSFMDEQLGCSDQTKLASGSMHDLQLPVLPPATTPVMAPYRPLIDGSTLCKELKVGNESLTGDKGVLTVQRKILAQEVVLIALTAFVLDVWEQDSSGEKAYEQDHDDAGLNLQKLLVRSVEGMEASNKGFEFSREALLDLGRILRDTAHACQGVSAHEQDMLNRRARKKKKEQQQAKANEEVDRPQEVIEVVQDDVEDAYVEEEQLPIQSSKILALQGKLSLEELALLVDMADAPQHVEEGKDAKSLEFRTTIFGPLTPERFVHNLLRWILGHDERQTEMLEATVHEAQSSIDLAEDMNGSKPSVGSYRASIARRSAHVRDDEEDAEDAEGEDEDEFQLWREIDKLQEENSNVSEDDLEEEEQQELGGSFRGLGGTIGATQHQATTTTFKSRSTSADSTWRGKSFLRGLGVSVSFISKQSREDVDAPRSRCSCLKGVKLLATIIQYVFGQEGALRRQRRRVTKRFKELDEDGEGVGVGEVAQLLGVAFHHTVTPEQQQHLAYRVFELLEKDETGGLVMLPELLGVLQKLTEELRDQQRKGRATRGTNTGLLSSFTRLLSLMTLPPDTWWLQYWDLLKELICAYYMIEVPVKFCFVSTDSLVGHWARFISWMNMFSDSFMGLNMLLHFFRGFMHPTRGIVTNFEEIRIHYMFNYFTIDAIASFPWDLFVFQRAGTSAGRGLLARPYSTSRLLKLLHLRNLFLQDWTRLARKSQMGESFMGAAAYMVCVMVTLVHFLACIWWVLGSRFEDFVAAYRDDDDQMVTNTLGSGARLSWLYTYVHRPTEPPFGEDDGTVPFWWQYLVSFYWCLGRITGNNSPGNLFPGSWAELGFTCLLFLLNVAVNGYCDGILVDKVIGGDEGVIEASAMRSIVDQYLQIVELPPNLINEVRASAEASADVYQRRRIEEVGRQLPHPLRQRIGRRIFLPFFNRSDIFTKLSRAFCIELAVCCRFVTVGKDTQLTHIGEPVKELLILHHGLVVFMDEAGRMLGESGQTGEMFAELPFIFDMKHAAAITAVEESKVVSLARSDFLAICSIHPTQALALRREAVKVVEARHGDTASQSEEGLGRQTTTRQTRQTQNADDAKSAVSRGSRGSRSSDGSNKSLKNSISRLYLRDLAAVLEKSRQDEIKAHQTEVCKFVEFAAQGEVQSVRDFLHKAVVQVDEGDYDQRTAMHLACCNGHLEVVRELVEGHNASIWVKDRFGATPMDDAVREEQPEIAKYLLQCGAQYQVDVGVASQLCEAAFGNNIKLLHLLVCEVKVDPNCADYDSRTALHLAACEGHMEAAQLLLSIPGLNLSPRDRLGNTPLDDAMRHRHGEMRRVLQERGAEMGDRNVGVDLCTYGADNDCERLRDMVESGVPVNEGDYDARTSLHLASSVGNLEAATYLLKTAKANPNPLDRFLNTPLDDALRHSRETMAMLLTENGGLTGKDEKMKQAVEDFKQSLEEQKLKKDQERLDRETKNTEVASLRNSVRRLVEHPTLEDDVYAFATCAENFRVQLLHLLRGTLENNSIDKTGRMSKTSVTKQLREKMLEMASAGLDSAGARLVATFEAEVAPWANKLTKQERRLLQCLVPGLRESVQTLGDGLRMRTKLIGGLKKLWAELGSYGEYTCPPMGLMAYRMLNRNMFVLHDSRVQAGLMVWLSKAHSDSSHGEAKQSKDKVDASQEGGGEEEQPLLLLSTGVQMILAEPAAIPINDDLDDPEMLAL